MRTEKISCYTPGPYSDRKPWHLGNLVFIVSFLPGIIHAQNQDFRVLFGERYQEAMVYLVENLWMIDTIASYGEDPAFVMAIGFPELIRYSALKDRMESLALYALYVQYGDAYADFSVGRFQMKPSFAEQIEMDWGRLHGSIPWKIDSTSNQNSRNKRLRRLRSANDQLTYLIYFCKVMEDKYANKHWSSVEEKLRFFATAYHAGYQRTEADILKLCQQQYFHTAVFTSAEKYGYADISLYFFRKMKGMSTGKAY